MADGYTTLDTNLIHAGEREPRIDGAVNLPIFQSSTYEYSGDDSDQNLRYIRLNNTPNHQVLHRKLSVLENAEAALVTSSGMAAISTTLLSVLEAGDHLLIQDCLYGGTHTFIRDDFKAMGISYDFIDGQAPETWKRKLKPRTKAVYVETLTNPLLQIADHPAVTSFAREHGLISLIDNTFASPVNFRPAEWGFDLILHSCSKYLNGHSDIVAGAVIGRADLVERVALKLIRLGGTLDPHACFLLHRGIKTLAVRVRHQNAGALALARFLQNHPAVNQVNYPGLPNHPRHLEAKRLFDGFGGMLSFELNGDAGAAKRFLKKIRLGIVAPSLGGVETLLTRPATTSHHTLTPEARHRLGITDGLIRISVGLESIEDIQADLERALGA